MISPVASPLDHHRDNYNRDMIRHLLLAATMTLLTATSAHTQTDPSQTPTLHLSAQLVLLDASVELRKTGAHLPGLTASDFTLLEDKDPQTITYLSEGRLPLSLVFLFDATDSVAPVLRFLAIGSNSLLDHLRPGDEVSVMTFSSHATLVQDFTTYHPSIEEAISKASHVHDEHVPTLLAQDMADAAAQSLRATIPNSRHVEVWLTDATSNYGKPDISPALAREQVLRSNVVVSGLIEQSDLTAQIDPHLVQSGGAGQFGDFARLTGGIFLNAKAVDVTAGFATIIDSLRQRYALGFKPSAQKPAGTLCPLHLQLSDQFWNDHPQFKRNDLIIRTRASYYR
jgi:VWFA-related protein